MSFALLFAGRPDPAVLVLGTVGPGLFLGSLSYRAGASTHLPMEERIERMVERADRAATRIPIR